MPDTTLDNQKVTALVRNLSMLHVSLWRRGFRPPAVAAWEMVLSPGYTQFALTVPTPWEIVGQKQLLACWPKATIQKQKDPFARFQPTAGGYLHLKEHYMFPLAADHRTNEPLQTILEMMGLLEEHERLGVQILLEPAPPDWWEGAAEAFETFQKGKMPKRLRADWGALLQTTALGTATVLWEVLNIALDFFGVPPEKLDTQDKRALALRERPSQRKIIQKLGTEAFDATIRFVVEAKEPKARAILRGLGFAYRTLDGDNALLLKEANPHRILRAIRKRRAPAKLNHDYLGVHEVSQLLNLPTRPLQVEHQVSHIDKREVALPKVLTKGGLYLGDVTYQGKTERVYLPIDNEDEFCLPHIVAGGMGMGKTTLAQNVAVEAVDKGYTVITIDPEKGDIAKGIQTVVPDTAHYVFGKVPYNLDWREAKYIPNGRSRMASELLAFCENAGEPAGMQTTKYLRSAAKVIDYSLLDLYQLLDDTDYLATKVEHMAEQDRRTWEFFLRQSERRQDQSLEPVFNRLYLLAGDDYLWECMQANAGIDFVDLIDNGPKAICIDIPKSIGREAQGFIGALLQTKLDLAMSARRTKHPVVILQDEPHQYAQSARTWKNVAVESRQWRFSYWWFFHSWEQIDRSLRAIMQSALPHYHLYNSSKATFKALEEEIAPFTPDELIHLERYWACNIIRAGGKVQPPFLAKMAPPPKARRN